MRGSLEAAAQDGSLGRQVLSRMEDIGVFDGKRPACDAYLFDGRSVSMAEVRCTIDRVIARMAEGGGGLGPGDRESEVIMGGSKLVLGLSSKLRALVLSHMGSLHYLLPAARVCRSWRRSCEIVAASGRLSTLNLSLHPTVRDAEVVWMLRRFQQYVQAIDWSGCKGLTDTPLIELLQPLPSGSERVHLRSLRLRGCTGVSEIGLAAVVRQSRVTLEEVTPLPPGLGEHCTESCREKHFANHILALQVDVGGCSGMRDAVICALCAPSGESGAAAFVAGVAAAQHCHEPGEQIADADPLRGGASLRVPPPHFPSGSCSEKPAFASLRKSRTCNL